MKEQEQLRTELKAKVDHLMETFARDPNEIVQYLLFAERFSHYSPANMRLLYAQNPNAQYVAPASAFRNGLPDANGNPLSEQSIFIRKGERALRIWKPTVTPCVWNPDAKRWIARAHLTEEECTRAKAENWKTMDVRRFILVPVFDVAQTDLPPELYPKLLGFGRKLPDMDGKIVSAIAYAENVLHCEVRENADLGKMRASVRGLFDPEQNRILLSDMLQGDGKLSTLLHEIGHAELHKDLAAAERPGVQKELEADLYALLLEQHLGVETTDARKAHLQAHYGAYLHWVEEQPKERNVKLNEPFDNAIRRYQEQSPQLDIYLKQAIQQGASVTERAVQEPETEPPKEAYNREFSLSL